MHSGINVVSCAVVFHDHANSTPRPDAEVIMSECDAPDRCGSLGYCMSLLRKGIHIWEKRMCDRWQMQPMDGWWHSGGFGMQKQALPEFWTDQVVGLLKTRRKGARWRRRRKRGRACRRVDGQMLRLRGGRWGVLTLGVRSNSVKTPTPRGLQCWINYSVKQCFCRWVWDIKKGWWVK